LAIAGVLLLAWGQKDRLAGWLARLRPTPKPDSAAKPVMEPAERFATLFQPAGRYGTWMPRLTASCLGTRANLPLEDEPAIRLT